MKRSPLFIGLLAALSTACVYAVPPNEPAPANAPANAAPDAAAKEAAVRNQLAKKAVPPVGGAANAAVADDAPAPVPAPAPAVQPGVRVGRVGVAIRGGPVIINNTNMLDLQRQNIRAQAQQYNTLAVAGTFKQDDLVHLSIVDGALRADTNFGKLAPGQQNRVKVDGTTSTWLVNFQNINGGFNNIGTYINVSRYDFDKTGDDDLWLVQLNINENINDNSLTLNANGVGLNLTYSQMNNMVSLTANKLQNNRYNTLFQFTAPSLLRLQSDHPEEVRQYLVPLLRRFSTQDVLSPGPTDVYTVFSELAPTAPVSKSFAALLPKLDADLFTERDAASKELAALGAPGIEAALRANRATLTEEQKGRVDAFIASGRRRSSDDPAALRKDAGFLSDCLEDTDPEVRAAAKASLEKVLGRTVAFDVSADAEKRTAALMELRKSLKKDQDARAATQPAATPTVDVNGPVPRPLPILRRGVIMQIAPD